MIKSDFVYFTPEFLDIAYDLKKKNDNSVYLGGGTDYIPLLKYNLKKPNNVISLDKLMELKKIEKDEKGIFIGSMVTLRDIYENNFVLNFFPSLAQAARRVASPQIRNIGTIGGNILQDRRCMYFNQSEDWRSNIEKCFKAGGNLCHQAPKSKICRALYYSDIAPVLLSLDAEAEIFDGKLDKISIRELIKNHIDQNGLLKTHDYILTGFYIPYLPKNSCVKFEKYSLRASIDFPTMNVGVRYSQDGNNTVIKIIVGAVSPEPIELIDTENMIINSLGNLKTSKDDIANFALTELTKKSQLIRETGLSIKVKRNTFKNILNVVDDLIFMINQNN